MSNDKQLLEENKALRAEVKFLKEQIRDIAGSTLNETGLSLVTKMATLAKSFEIPDDLIPPEFKNPVEIPDNIVDVVEIDEEEAIPVVEIDEEDIIEVLSPIEID